MTNSEQERWLVTASVAALLSVRGHKRLILVRDRESQTWGLPAGGLQRGERLVAGLRREIGQETNLPQERLYFKPRPHIVCLPREDRTQLGLVFDTVYVKERQRLFQWDAKDDRKVDQTRIFTPRELFQLLEHPDEFIYKQWFNFPQLMRWMVRISNTNVGAPIEYLDRWLRKMEETVEGLTLVVDTVLRDYRTWKYCPPYVDVEPTLDLWGNPIIDFSLNT